MVVIFFVSESLGALNADLARNLSTPCFLPLRSLPGSPSVSIPFITSPTVVIVGRNSELEHVASKVAAVLMSVEIRHLAAKSSQHCSQYLSEGLEPAMAS